MKIFRKIHVCLKIGQKYGALNIKNQVSSIFRDDCYRQKYPLSKGHGISIMLAEVV